MPTKDSADKWYSPMDGEITRQAAACSCAVAWRVGPRSGPWRRPNLYLSRCSHVGPKRQSSNRLKPKSSA